MITPLVLAGSLFCKTPELENRTKEWNEQDQTSLLHAQKEGCRKHDAQEPCLVRFVKVEEGVYTAVCGPEQRRK